MVASSTGSSVRQTSTGSWAAYVISHQSKKKVLLGTYGSCETAWASVRRYEKQDDTKPSATDVAVDVSSQGRLFPDDD